MISDLLPKTGLHFRLIRYNYNQSGGEGIEAANGSRSGGRGRVVLYCREITPDIMKLQQILAKAVGRAGQIILYKENTEYYMETDKILFFETEGTQVLAHTETELFETHKKLYELEEVLGGSFLRISKSAIVNLNRIYAIQRSLTASSEIAFQGTHKRIYVSRAYYKALKEKLEEKRLGI